MAITRVSGQHVSTTGTGLSLSASLTNNPTAGNFVVACVCCPTAASITFTVKDGNNNTYAATTHTPGTDGSFATIGIYYLSNAPANASKTVTVSQSTSQTVDLWVQEYAGVATSSPLEQEQAHLAYDETASTSINLPSYTPNNANDLIITVAQVQSAASGAGSGYSLIDAIQNNDAACDNIQTTATATGTYETQSPAGTWIGMVAAFKAAVATTSIGWFKPLAEPQRQPPALSTANKDFNVNYVRGAPPIIPSFGWFEPLAEPQRQPPSLAAANLATTSRNRAGPIPIIPSYGWYKRLAEPQRQPPELPPSEYIGGIYAPQPPIISFGWFMPLAEPQKQPPELSDAQHQALAWTGITIATGVPSFGWFMPLAEPQRPVPSTLDQQQSIGFGVIIPSFGWFRPFDIPLPPPQLTTAEIERAAILGQPPIIPSYGYYMPLGEPQRPLPSLPPSQQQAVAWTPLIIAAMAPNFGWFQPLAEPQRQIPELVEAMIQSLASPPPQPSGIALSGWFQALAEPQRQPPRLPPGQQQVSALGQPPIIPSFGWFEALGEPQRQPPRLQPGSEMTEPFPVPVIIPSYGWFQPLAEPVRLPPSLAKALQFVTQQYPAQPPVVVLNSAALAAIEQGDQAQFTITVYNTPTSVIIGISTQGTI